MRFFEGVRPQFYFHGARIRKDTKTARRLWRIDMVITLAAPEVLQCDEIVQRNYEHILTLDYRNNELGIEAMVPEQTIDFFALKDAKESLLCLTRCDLDNLRLTRVEEIAELWVQLEVESTDAVCDFVKEHVFTRLWVEFKPGPLSQMDLKPVADAVAQLAAPIARDGGSITISGAGRSVTIDQPAAQQILQNVAEKRGRKPRK